MKLVVNKKVVRLPRASNGVEETLRKAILNAKRQKWKNVVIVADSTKLRHALCSKMSTEYAVGLIEIAKYIRLEDM